MISNTSLQRRWWVLASLWTLYASFGLVAGSLAPLLSHIRNDLNMSHAAMGAALGAWPFVYLAVSAVVGKVLDRVGVRVGLALGAALIGMSGLLRGAAQSGTGLWLAVAVFGLGGPFISIGAPKLVTQWFTSQERGLAVGVYSTAPSVGWSRPPSCLLWRLAMGDGDICLRVVTQWSFLGWRGRFKSRH